MQGRSGDTGALLRFGATVSVVQSVLFVVIGVCAAVLGVDQLVEDGFASLPASNLTAFRALCGAFVVIAVLGLAITPAERRAVGDQHAGWADLGASLAYLGHAGTIAFFSWWLVATRHGATPDGSGDLMPLAWGAGFELVLVGAWVWIIAALIRRDVRWPGWFWWLSVAKATSFWTAYIGLLSDRSEIVVVTVGAVSFVTGPAWHLSIAGIFRRFDMQEQQ
ncbi:MAG: hypothetical protein WCC60_22750 [Ilumatobacteraceae bacterium]